MTANGGTDVSAWTADTQTVQAKLAMPDLDSISFTAVGIVGQNNTDWQNRPTYQEVVEFPVPRAPAIAPVVPLPNTAIGGAAALLLLPVGLLAVCVLPRRRRSSRGRR